MRTSEEIYHRVRWDPRFDPERFVLGVHDRSGQTKRVRLTDFTPGGDIPWHRILFIEADGEVVWDRATGVDRIDGSTAGRVRRPRRLTAPFFVLRPPHAWRPGTGWRPAEPAGEAPPVARLRVLTWNTLWDRYDGDRIDTARRRPLLLEALRRADADVIALQEVEPDLLDLLCHEPWVRDRYTLSLDPHGRDTAEYGLLLLSRLPVTEAGLCALGPHKAAAALVVATADGPITVAATHLTSDHTVDGAARRTAELALLAEALPVAGTDVVLVGDFNDGDPALASRLGLDDAWTQVHGADDHTPTFDPGANPLAALSSRTGRAARLDRVLLRGTGLHATAARLLGDAPATGDGLFASDHYGVVADIAVGGSGDAPSDVLDTAPSARTALVWLPPEEPRPTPQHLCGHHHPDADRWPPHVPVLSGFVPEADFERAAPLLAEAAATVAPFDTRLRGTGVPARHGHPTAQLDPALSEAGPWQQLRAALRRRFPRCGTDGTDPTPHPVPGRAADPDRSTAEHAAQPPDTAARVSELVLLSRRGGEPMRPRATVALGTGEVRWLDEPAPAPAETPAPAPPTAGAAAPRDTEEARLVARLAEALPEATLHLVGSRRMGCARAGSDLDLVAALPGQADLDALAARVSALPGSSRVRHITGARTPGLRLRLGPVPVDLVVVATGEVDPAEAVARRTELGDAAAAALSAVSDAEAVRAAVDGRHTAFAALARDVRAWAFARGLDCAPFGGLPGLAWTVLAARTVRDSGADDGPDTLLGRFFAEWAAWDWRRPVTLPTAPTAHVPAAPVRILTPTAPVRSCTGQVDESLRDLLDQELYRAWETVEEAARTGTDPRPALCGPPPLHRRHAAWAVVEVRPLPGEHVDTALGRVRGRMRALLTALAEAGVADAHAWPRPFTADPRQVCFAVGLGRTPPDAAALADVTGPWRARLPGVRVHRADGGQVPTLR